MYKTTTKVALLFSFFLLYVVTEGLRKRIPVYGTESPASQGGESVARDTEQVIVRRPESEREREIMGSGVH